MINVQTDFTAIHERLKKLDEKTLKKALRSGLVYAAGPLKKEMKTRAPFEHGTLKQSIGHIQINQRQKARLGIPADKAGIIVGPNRKVGGRQYSRIAQILEGGAKAHKIKPKKQKGFLRFGDVFAKSVDHPGIKATHFMELSLTATNGIWQSRFYDGLSRYLDKYGS